jgi:phosphatidate cytidylyltransferase
MALNKEVFKTRSLTAVVFVAVMLLGLFWNVWSFTTLFLIIHFGCWYEWVKLLKKIKGTGFLSYCLLGLPYITLPVLLLISLRGDVEIIFTSLFDAPLNITRNQHPALSLHPYLFPCAIIFSIWINDTMAYVVGSLIGKTPFSSISPKKTWEGTGGGALLCIGVIGLLGYTIPAARAVAVQHWVAIAAICAVFGTAGDLLESKLKRLAGVKDSGSFMPGHGGFLDRFDSLLLATPFVWLYVWLFV